MEEQRNQKNIEEEGEKEQEEIGRKNKKIIKTHL